MSIVVTWNPTQPLTTIQRGTFKLTCNECGHAQFVPMSVSKLKVGNYNFEEDAFFN